MRQSITRRHAALLGSSAVLAGCARSSMTATDNTEVLDTSIQGTDMQDTTDWANLSKSEWKDRLTEQEFYVLRQEGTERPFTSPLNDVKEPGTFVCAGCRQPLFKTAQKYDSGTGWPSFFDYIDGSLETKRDFKMVVPRTEYHCSRCGGHQGHVFKDGPNPTGLRYCNNGVALDFVPETET